MNDPWVYIDIETSPPLSTFPNAAAVTPPKNYKDPKKIEAYQSEHAYSFWAGKAVSLPLAQVIMIGAAVDDGPVWQCTHASEKEILTEFWTWLQDVAPLPEDKRGPMPVLCAYNGVGFDFPILAARACKHGLVDMARRMKPNRWGDATHRDPFLDLGRDGKLVEWAESFGIERTTNVTGGEVFELIHQGKHPLALQKNHDDVRILRELTKRLRAGGLM